MARRFSNPCFKLPRKADRGSPLAVVGGNGVAIVVAQINATNNRKVFILLVIRTVKKHTINILTQFGFEFSCQNSTIYLLFVSENSRQFPKFIILGECSQV